MKFLLFIFIFVLAGCTHFSSQERRQSTDALAATQQWQKLPLPTRDFVLMAYVPPVVTASETLAIYIEGDGWHGLLHRNHLWIPRQVTRSD
jgi:hypothetical protein